MLLSLSFSNVLRFPAPNCHCPCVVENEIVVLITEYVRAESLLATRDWLRWEKEKPTVERTLCVCVSCCLGREDFKSVTLKDLFCSGLEESKFLGRWRLLRFYPTPPYIRT